MPFKIGDRVIYYRYGRFDTGYVLRVGKTLTIGAYRYNNEYPDHPRCPLKDCRLFECNVWDEINRAQGRAREFERRHWASLAQAQATFDSLPLAEDQA